MPRVLAVLIFTASCALVISGAFAQSRTSGYDEDDERGIDGDLSVRTGVLYRSSPCGAGSFFCENDHRCIRDFQRCDGIPDCGEAEDEMNCTLPKTSANCDIGRYFCPLTRACLLISTLCDGEVQCGDYDEVSYLACQRRHHQLTVERCTLLSQRQTVNRGRFAVCYMRREFDLAPEFETCVYGAAMCDGVSHCEDNSDEDCSSLDYEVNANSDADCSATNGQFRCALSKQCINLSARCDGQFNCVDSAISIVDVSDEANCDTCFQCASTSASVASACIDRRLICDGHVDCPKGDDEQDCPARQNVRCFARCASADEKDGVCLEAEDLCNGRPDCADSFDESPDWCERRVCNVSSTPSRRRVTTIAPATAISPSICDSESTYCQNSPVSPGFICACRTGFELAASTVGWNSSRCVPTNPCREWGTCSQRCIQDDSSSSSYKCGCYDGFTLDSRNNVSCKPTDQSDLVTLLYLTRYEVKRLDMRTTPDASGGRQSKVVNVLVKGNKQASSLDVDIAEKLVFWVDAADDVIYRARLGSSTLTDMRVTLRVGIAAVEGVAVEWVTKKIYFVESLLDSIDVANYDGSQRTALIVGSVANPRAIAVDPLRGYIFWSDWEPSKARIERAALDGDPKSRRILVDATIGGGGWPNGLTLDYDSMRVFWVDARSDAVYTMTYEGTEVRMLANRGDHLSHPFAISMFDEFLYWTDWRSNRLVRASKFDANASIVRLDSMTTQPYDVKVLHPLRQRPPRLNPCASAANPCVFPALCVIGRRTTPSSTSGTFELVASCRCPYLYEPEAGSNVQCRLSAAFLFVASASPRPVKGQLDTSVRSFDLNDANRTAAPALFTSARLIVLAFNPAEQTVLWLEATSPRNGLIRRFALNATRRAETLVDRDVPNLSAFAADAASRLMYFATAVALADQSNYFNSTIWVATINGAYRRPLLSLRTYGTVSAIALHPAVGRMFFNSNDTLYSVLMDGSGLSTVLDSTRSPLIVNASSLTCDSTRQVLFWIAPLRNSSDAQLVACDYAGDKVTVIELVASGTSNGTRASNSRRLLAVSAYRSGLIVALTDRVVRVNLTSYSSAASVFEFDVLKDNVQQTLTVSMYEREVPFTTACSNRTVQCAQLCLPRGQTESSCACVQGFQLDAGTKCNPLPVRFVALLGDASAPAGVRNDEAQVLSNSVMVNSGTPDDANFAANRFALPQVGLAVTAAEFDPVKRRFFFFSNDTRRVVTVGLDLREQRTVVQGLIGANVRDFAYDWVNENLYIADSDHHVIEAIHVAESERHAARYVVVNSGLIRKPHSLVVSPEYNLLCWLEPPRNDDSLSTKTSSSVASCTDLRGYLQERFVLPAAHSPRSLALFFGRPNANDSKYPTDKLIVAHLVYCDEVTQSLFSLNVRVSKTVRQFVERNDAPMEDFGATPEVTALYTSSRLAPQCDAGISVDQVTAKLYYTTLAGSSPQPTIVGASLSVQQQSFRTQTQSGVQMLLQLGDVRELQVLPGLLRFRVPPLVTDELLASVKRVSACPKELGCEMCLPTVSNVTQQCACDFGSWNVELHACQGIDSVVLFSVRDAIVGVHYAEVTEFADAATRGWQLESPDTAAGLLNLTDVPITPINSSTTYLTHTGIQLFQNERMSAVLMLAYSYSRQLLFFSDLQRAEIQALLLGTNMNSLRGNAMSDKSPGGGWPFSDEPSPASSANGVPGSYNIATLFGDVAQPEGLAFDELFSALYFLSASAKTISRFELTTRGQYWRCEEARVYKRRLERGEKLSDSIRRVIDSCEPRVIVRLQEEDRPRSLAIDSCARLLFWANWAANKPRIQRSDLFGRNVTDIVTQGVRVPNSVAVDLAERRLYYADAGFDQIVSCNYDGSNCQVIVSDAAGNVGLQHVFSIAIHREALYWSDWNRAAVYRANKRSGRDQQLLRIAGDERRQVMGLLVIDASTQPSAMCNLDACDFENGGCDELCGYHDGEVVCSCHSDWLFDATAKQCHNPFTAENCNTTDVFLCRTGACIPFSLTCDKFAHCADGSDESATMCETRSCPVGYFACGGGSGQCIPIKYRCDGVKHCRDGSEEDNNCTCPEVMPFRCGDKCIALRSVCDQQIDCPDASDELRSNCGMAFCESPTFSRSSDLIRTSFPFFACGATSLCYADFQRCDGRDDCGDNTDELNCSSINWRNDSIHCGPNMFLCGSGECIAKSAICNEVFDCRDSSDEQSCPCPADKPPEDGYFSCGSGGCLSEYRVCDGFHDCMDGSDETNCTSRPCSNSSFHCASGKCISYALVCDGHADCGIDDRSDETVPDCQPICMDNEVMCADGRYCIPSPHFCDQHPDCQDGSDEIGCDYVRCNDTYQFACHNERQCISLSQKCDGTPQCSDGSDETVKVCEELRTEFFERCGSPKLFFCEPLGRCLNTSLFCDRVVDCPDRRDESLCGLTDAEICANAVPQCDGICVVQPDRSTRCECPPGTRFGKTVAGGSATLGCHDVNECESDVCSQLCVNLVSRLGEQRAGYRCSCADGYALLPDRRSCRAVSGLRPLLAFGADNTLRLRDTLSGADLGMFDSTANSIDFLVEQSTRDLFAFRLFWTEERNVIRTANCSVPIGKVAKATNCSTSATLPVELGLSSVEVLAVDWIGRNLYWFADDALLVANLDGVPMQRTIRNDLADVVAIAVHSLRGVLVYIELAELRIVRMSLDGVHEQLLLDSNVISLPVSVAIDLITDRVYVFDKLSNELISISLDGSRARIVAETSAEFPPSLALGLFEDTVWISDVQRVSILPDQANVSSYFAGSLSTPPTTLSASTSWMSSSDLAVRDTSATGTSGVAGARFAAAVARSAHREMGGLAIIHPLRQPPQTATPELCAGCSELCLLKLGGHSAVCACPDNFVRNTATNRCEARCPEDSFACERSLRCIPAAARCDRANDCPLGEDEDPKMCAGRSYNCSGPRMFVCNASTSAATQCVDGDLVCNNRADCADGSDEAPELCCGAGAMACETDRDDLFRVCIRGSSVCNGVPDCDNGEDERNCSTINPSAATQCGPLLFTCASGKCIPRYWQCDLSEDCDDGSDETGCMNSTACTAANGSWRCDKGKCIKAEWKCDGEHDCGAGDNSDEDERCQADETRCASGFLSCNSTGANSVRTCILMEKLCDGSRDCPAGEDERNCVNAPNATCAAHEMPCRDRSACIPLSQRCDGKQHCKDRSDELNCPPVLVSNPSSLLNNFFPSSRMTYFELNDDVSLPYEQGTETFSTRRRACDQYGSTIYCMLTNSCERGDSCDGLVDCAYGEDEQFCSGRTGVCPFAHFKCPPIAGNNSSQCIPLPLVCNAVKDCLDGSDESPTLCNNFGYCANPLARKWPCPRQPGVSSLPSNASVCVPSEKLCDTVSDCVDGADEQFCAAGGQRSHENVRVQRLTARSIRASDCKSQSRQADYVSACGSNTKCVPEHQVCDGFVDCRSGQDELCSGSSSRRLGFATHYDDCSVNNGFCEQICVSLPPQPVRLNGSQPMFARRTRFACKCYDGYRLREDRRTCESTSPCSHHATCSHICRPTGQSGLNRTQFECHCPGGYTYVGAPLGCRPEKSARYPKIVMPTGDYMSVLHAFESSVPVTFSQRMAVAGLHNNSLLSFDYDPLSGNLYGITIGTSRIVRLVNFLNDPSLMYDTVNLLPTMVGRPIDLALNWPAGHIYWFDAGLLNEMNVAIKLCTYDGSRIVTVINVTHNPREVNTFVHGAIAIDVVHKRLYSLIVMDDEAWLESSTLYGLDRKRLRQSFGFPYGLAIDVWNRRLYYTDISKFEVISTDLDGQKPAVVFQYNAARLQETVMYVDVALHALILTTSKGSVYAVHKFTRVNSTAIAAKSLLPSADVTSRRRRSSEQEVDSLPVRKHKLIRTLRDYEGLADALNYDNLIFIGGAQAGSRVRTIMQMSDYDSYMIANPCDKINCAAKLRGSLCIPRSTSSRDGDSGGQCMCSDSEYVDVSSNSCRRECDVCQNGGECHFVTRDGRDVPVCKCRNPFTGDYCTDVRCPDGLVCRNNGLCLLRGALEYGYECDCRPPFSGDKCDVLCTAECGKHGWCTYNKTQGVSHCICNPGYHGARCEVYLGLSLTDDSTSTARISILAVVCGAVIGFAVLCAIISCPFVVRYYRRHRVTSMFARRRFTDADEDMATTGSMATNDPGVRVISSGRSHGSPSGRIVKIRGAEVQVQNPIYMMDTENDQLVDDDADYEQADDEEREGGLLVDAYLDDRHVALTGGSPVPEKHQHGNIEFADLQPSVTNQSLGPHSSNEERAELLENN